MPVFRAGHRDRSCSGTEINQAQTALNSKNLNFARMLVGEPANTLGVRRR